MAQAISMKITDVGRVALLDFLRHCAPGSIIAVGWSEADEDWSVGAFNKEKIPPSEVVTISGIPFVFDQGDSQRLNGKTLDFRDGVFCVV
ncbi:MAG: hypothetical protein OEW21_07740 [Betaproteobacteria bacterium]|nr:hypothetical protein [Betaproteobacteria bacterium]